MGGNKENAPTYQTSADDPRGESEDGCRSDVSNSGFRGPEEQQGNTLTHAASDPGDENAYDEYQTSADDPRGESEDGSRSDVSNSGFRGPEEQQGNTLIYATSDPGDENAYDDDDEFE